MKIVVIGAGAMGSIYGGRLSLHNEVTLVDTNPKVVEAVAENGLKLQENGMDNIYHPAAKNQHKGHGLCRSCHCSCKSAIYESCSFL